MKCQTSYKKHRGIRSILILGSLCLISVLLLLLYVGFANAATVTLAWDLSDGAAGYKIYYGTTSNNYSSVVDVGDNLTYTFTNLPDGNTYYFAATAYDPSRLESDYSAEISYAASSNSSLYANFDASSLYKWDGTSWSQMTSLHPTRMAASGSLLYGDFAGYGLYKWDGTSWSQMTSLHPTSMAASGSLLYGDFAASGLYKWDGTSWSQMTSLHPTSMVTGQ
jgi:hypothetical protein